MAIFGPNSFLTATATNSNYSTSTYTMNQLCAQLRFPFTGLAYTNMPTGYQINDIDWTPARATLECPSNPRPGATSPFLEALMAWMSSFGNKGDAIAALTLATYAAGNAILNIGPSSNGVNGYFIYASSGTSIQKPTIPLAGIIVISLLLITQIVGLMLLALYASRSATWTASLDSFAMLRIGGEIGKEELPAVSALEAKNAKILDEREGWIGDLEFETRHEGVDVRDLGLGGQGRVRDNVMYRMARG